MRFTLLCRKAAGKSYDSIGALRSRSLLYQCTDEASLAQSLAERKNVVYTGFDPTAQSLHVGNLLTIVSLMHFWAGGHRVIGLVGGGTGSIGDPSGKSKERVALDSHTVASNSECIERQLIKIFENGKDYLERRNVAGQMERSLVSTLNNMEWMETLSLIDFLRIVGRKARVSAMLAKDSVQGRMEGEGISFAEFTYQLLQAYDFQFLHNNYGCNIQLGGSDQFGNITAGLELIRKSKIDPKEETNAFGVTIPLVTTSTGEKFGKSEGNAIWLDHSLLSPFDFYQFFRKTEDNDVERFLHFFTFLSPEAIASAMKEHEVNLYT